MANIFASSIGKKIVMSLSGLFLMVFLVVHAGVNALLLVGREAYNEACHFMDTNPLIRVMVPVLALGFLIHIVYAIYLTWGNMKARGTERYAVSNKGQASSWAARNMFVLGIIVLGVLALHLSHFWAKMQLVEIMGGDENSLGLAPTDGYALIARLFANPLYCAIYLVWFAAIWFHLTHGIWSAIQTIGWNNAVWEKRLKAISYIVATIIFLGFAVVVVYFFLKGQGVL